MNKREGKLSTAAFCTCLILTIVASVGFIVINPICGIVVGFIAWMSYKKAREEIPTQEKSLGKETVNEDTKNLIGTLISEQENLKEKSFGYQSYHIIKRGSLPMYVHDILDEMGITTWVQLSLLDEKELLYQKCFGEDALINLKTELAKRGLTLNSSTSISTQK